jgi:hypothetical protein
MFSKKSGAATEVETQHKTHLRVRSAKAVRRPRHVDTHAQSTSAPPPLSSSLCVSKIKPLWLKPFPKPELFPLPSPALPCRCGGESGVERGPGGVTLLLRRVPFFGSPIHLSPHLSHSDLSPISLSLSKPLTPPTESKDRLAYKKLATLRRSVLRCPVLLLE